MAFSELPFRATTVEACDWLARQTGTPWSLARLIEHRLVPSVWLDHDGGYAAPLRIQGDARQLDGAGDVLITVAADGPQIASKLRFLKKDLERLAHKLTRRAAADCPA
jgi:hypothetical protein